LLPGRSAPGERPGSRGEHARGLAHRVTATPASPKATLAPGRTPGRRLGYVSVSAPGLRRRRRGRDFVYLDLRGESISDPRTLSRIRALAIPPAWTDVWICAQANGHLQAVGLDSRGRKQYLYHPAWRRLRDEYKFSRMLEFGRRLPGLRARVAEDMGRAGLERDQVVAAVVRLLDRTAQRVGNEIYAHQNGSYGLTTLRERHVELAGSRIRLNFLAKSHKRQTVELVDRQLARVVRSLQELPGQHLFRWLDDAGTIRDLDSADVNEYLHRTMGRRFTAKDFRTWSGSVLALEHLCGPSDSEAAADIRRRASATIRAVAETLGNTPAVCRRAYVHPAVLQAHATGMLAELARESPVGLTSAGAQLTTGERALIRLLRREARMRRQAQRAAGSQV